MYSNRMINDVIGSVKETKLKIFKKAQEINNLGAILDMFNLYYVASLIREQDVDIVYNARIYPSYRVSIGEDDVDEKTTKECIDNFVKRFSPGGKYEEYADKIGYDKNNPITEYNLGERIDEINDMMDIWDDIVVDDDLNNT